MLKKIIKILLWRFETHPIKKGVSYLCIDNCIGDFTVGKVYICQQNDYLEDDLRFFYIDKPIRNKDIWGSYGLEAVLSPDMFKEITWENEPIEAEIILKVASDFAENHKIQEQFAPLNI